MPPSPALTPTPAEFADPWELALLFLPFVRRVAREYRRGEWDTDDLIQEGLIGAHRAALRFDPTRGSFFRLVDVAVQNRMRQWLRWRKRAVPPSEELAAALARADRLDTADLDDAFFAVWCLPDLRRTIVREHCGLDGPARTAAEIGADLGMTRDAVAKNQSRALVKVREQLGVAS